ncbi:hypothetical protein LSM04_006841 [Trypanosoma melophagium]|uniref:uncharacterized protein n=1 Tax=Trypanosoma melophagium TaxID=715481 RepID=UPI00351A8A6C|nr:hypothetical protein LSM04_006841 [Trypanosoma melophagium]
MPYRVLITNIPTYVGEEEFYDYVRSHVGGESVVNALLIMRPIKDNEKNHNKHHNSNNSNNKQRQEDEYHPQQYTTGMFSSGAALVDYETKRAADAARRVDFHVDGVRVMMKAVGTAPTEREAAEKGLQAYEMLRRGFNNTTSTISSSTAITTKTTTVKRPRDASDDMGANDKDGVCTHEMELRLVGIPCEIYGSFFLTFTAGCAEVRPNTDGKGLMKNCGVDMAVGGTHTSQEHQSQLRSAVELFDDVARSVRRATLGGDLLSLRRISDTEAIIRVSTSTGESLLERATDGQNLNLHLEFADGDSSTSQQRQQYTLFVHRPRPHVQLSGDNFVLAKKHEVLQAMSRMMEITNGKIAGFVDPFGNYLLPSV